MVKARLKPAGEPPWIFQNRNPDTHRTLTMNQTSPHEGIKVESIFHPSDFSEASEVAFAHALKTALVAGATLSMLHVTAKANVEWQDFPGVCDTLEAHSPGKPQKRCRTAWSRCSQSRGFEQ